MSRESLTWLNTNTLIGCTDKRGTAWHWRAQEQGEQSNHYPGPIPLEDVQDRLFHWQAKTRRLAVEVPAQVVEATHWDSGLPMRWTVLEDKQAICRSDNDTVMGIFGTGYVRHQYREWLLSAVADLLDDDLAISSAGLLRGGAIAWVEVSMPDTITTPKALRSGPTCWPPPASMGASPLPTSGPSPTPSVTTPASWRCPRPGRRSRSSTAGTATRSSAQLGRLWRWCTAWPMTLLPRSPGCAPPPSQPASGSASWTSRCLRSTRRGSP